MEQENRRLKHRIDVLEREKNVLEQKVKRLTDDYEDLRKSTSQPQDYFMSMVDKAKLENETARSTIEDLRGEIESLSQSKEDAEVQLRKLLSNREQIKDLKKALLNAGVVARRTAYGEGMGGTMSQSPRNSRERGSPRWYKRLVKP
jgi:chromosome segregation ATPase